MMSCMCLGRGAVVVVLLGGLAEVAVAGETPPQKATTSQAGCSGNMGRWWGCATEVIAYDNLKWKKDSMIEGGMRAEGAYDQDVVRWPPGGGLAVHSRRGTWEGVVVSGRLTIQIAGGPQYEVEPKGFALVRAHVKHSVRCTSAGPCVFFAGFARPDSIEPIDDRPAPTDGRPNWLFLNLERDAVWEPLQSKPGAFMGSLWREGKPAITPGLFINLRTLRPLKFGKGAGLPLAVRGNETTAFVLSGVLIVQIHGESPQTLGPGSFLSVASQVSFSSSCMDDECFVLATDREPGDMLLPSGR